VKAFTRRAVRDVRASPVRRNVELEAVMDIDQVRYLRDCADAGRGRRSIRVAAAIAVATVAFVGLAAFGPSRQHVEVELARISPTDLTSSASDLQQSAQWDAH